MGDPPRALATSWHSALSERLGRSDIDQVHNLSHCALAIEGGEVHVAVRGTEDAINDWTGPRSLHTSIQGALDQALCALRH